MPGGTSRKIEKVEFVSLFRVFTVEFKFYLGWIADFAFSPQIQVTEHTYPNTKNNFSNNLGRKNKFTEQANAHHHVPHI